MKRILLLTLCLSLNALGQNKLSIGISVDYPVLIEDYDSPLHSFWTTGLDADIRAQIPIIEPISFRPALAYHYYFFNQFKQGAVAGAWAINSEGTGFQIVTLGGNVCIQEKEGAQFRPALLIGGGYSIERPGTMKITWLDFEGGRNVYTTESRDPNRSDWYFSMGLGIDYSLSKNISINTSFLYYTNKLAHPNLFRSYESYWMLNCGVSWEIMQFNF